MSLLKKARCLRNQIMFPGYVMKNFNSSDAVAVYPELGVVYNRIKKSGNTTITAFLADRCGIDYTSSRQVKSMVRCPKELGYRDILKVRDYYSFTFVRNPYSRVLSAFLQKLAAGKEGIFSSYPGFGVQGREGFDLFLAHLDSGGLYDNKHWWPQIDLLYKRPDEFSYIGRLERLDADMRVVLHSVGLDPAAADVLKVPHAVSNHTTNASSKENQYYSAKGREIVTRLYRGDFEAFDYPRIV